MKKKRKNGFSLIELIIAIAILIILTGLLAPQFMKYIEKSRQARDIQRLETIYQAFQVAYIEAVESGDNLVTTNIMIIKGEPALNDSDKDSKNTIEEAICESMSQSLGKEFDRVSISTASSGEGSDKEIYFFDRLLILLYSTEDKADFSNYAYYNMGLNSTYYPGTFGKCTNGKVVQWR